MGYRRRRAHRDPALDRAVLRETLALLDSGGYDRLRMTDIGHRAGIGLGALYRRWPTKYALVVDALRSAAPPVAVEPTDDPAGDLVTVLMKFATQLRRHRTLLAVLLTAPDSEVAAAVREAKLTPAREAVRTHLTRIIGTPADLNTRTDLGQALILQYLFHHGTTPDEAHIRETILPLMTGRPVSV